MYAASFIQLSIHTYVHLLCNAAVKLEQLSSVLENDWSLIGLLMSGDTKNDKFIAAH